MIHPASNPPPFFPNRYHQALPMPPHCLSEDAAVLHVATAASTASAVLHCSPPPLHWSPPHCRLPDWRHDLARRRRETSGSRPGEDEQMDDGRGYGGWTKKHLSAGFHRLSLANGVG